MMDGSKRANSNDERNPGDGSELPWQTGIRRRRRNSSNSEEEKEELQRQSSTNVASSPHHHHHDVNRNVNGGSTNFNTGVGVCGGATIGVGGSCGGLGTQSPATFGMVDDGAPSTPYKASPSLSTRKDLVAITPSSVTTAETAGSTLYTQSPLRVHRRRSSRRVQYPATPRSLRRQYELLQTQTILLLGGAAVALTLFLFFALPLTAFISFAFMVASIGALVPIASSAVRARYELEMDHPLGLLRYLPDSLRVLLTETSLHQWMVEGTFWMEYRHLLLYIIPGLDSEQLMMFINRLPPRHRDVLLQPGLGRLLPPSTMRHFIRMDGNGAANSDTAQLPQILENGDMTDVSIASGLTNDRDDQLTIIDEVGENEQRVTFLEAISSLRETLISAEQFSLNENLRLQSPGFSSFRVDNYAHAPIATAPVTVRNDAPVCEQQDDSSFDISIDLDMTDIARQSGTNVPAHLAENILVEVSRSPAELAIRQEAEESQANHQEEFDIEGRIISDAISSAVANYSLQASRAVTERLNEAADSVTTWFIRAGTWTGFVAGGGGILAAVVSSSSPFSIALGTFSGLVSSNASRGGANGNTTIGDAVDRRNQNSSQLVNGLLTTSVFGFVGAGISYLIRNRVRGAIAEKRQKILDSCSDDEEK